MKDKRKEFLTRDEAINVLKQPDRRTQEGLRDFCILSLMIHTGLRRDEICNLRRMDLKTDGDEVNLHILGKGAKTRFNPIEDEELLEALPRYFKRVNNLDKPNEPMFYNLRMIPLGGRRQITRATVRYLIPKYVRMAGITKRITPHSLRHTFLTLTLQAGADLATVKELAGHSNVGTTSVYLHTTEERKREAVKRLRL